MLKSSCFVVPWLVLLMLADASAQQPASPAPQGPSGSGPLMPVATVCGQQVRPAAQPPAGSSPVVLFMAPCFAAQGGTSIIEPSTYVYYMQLKTSQPSQGMWIPYDASTEQLLRGDFSRLMTTGFLDNLSIETEDYTFPNGTIGKIVLYNMEERERIKIGPDYEGSKALELAKIDEALRAMSAEIRLDTFIDQGLVRKVEGIVREMMKEKGFQNAEVTHEIKPVAGGPKLIHLIFNIAEGPKVKIRKIDFIGNTAIADGDLKGQMKSTREQWWLSFINGRGTYQETKFDEDAGKIVEYYQDRGYIKANVGAPETRVLGDSEDKKTRWIELRIPITEGPRYRVGMFDISGNTVADSERLKPLFGLKEGEFYSLKSVRDGLEKAREVYGAAGYFEFTGFPDYKFSDERDPAAPEAPSAIAALETVDPSPTVDVTMRLVEGVQYFINRITFVGNTTTHDNVIRREMRLLEDGVFNTEALKFSIRRLNQLGYFKPLEAGRDVTVDKTPGETNQVDVKVKLEEQNRNQISFGAGVSEFEGFFGQASFQTSNFLGRGESLTVSLSAGSRAQNYTVAFTEPFLFDRNMTGSANVYRNNIRYEGQFTQQSAGTVLGFGYPLRPFTRMFINYSYEHVRVTEVNELYRDPLLLARNPFLRDSLLLGDNGLRVISKITPSVVHNTVDQPIFPNQGKRYTAAFDLAGFGGNTEFYKPSVEGIWFFRENSRMSIGMRAQTEYIHALRGTALPIFTRLFLGGEYSVRGFDIRSIGPKDPVTGLVLGGNKSLLFNVEQNFNIMSQFRIILFYDAGQVRGQGDSFSWEETLIERVIVPPTLFDPFVNPAVLYSINPETITRTVSAFKTSTGVEARLFMPVINVPFRLIFAYNPQRAGVLGNDLRPQEAFQFRFAVGSTF
ncbi:MAG TPA: BamA/TamA family outer membrane protein [Vicinamibacterales bacterium]|nr:BamA/TamA family outer membrane protein [Vicinamibacterales bacterium]